MSSNKKESTGEEIYSGVATFGRVSAVIGVIIGTLAGLIMIPIGIYLLTKKVKKTASTDATIENADCTESAQDSTISFNCTLNVNYKVGNVPYSGVVTSSGPTHYMSGKKVKVYYDPSNPKDVALDSGKSKHIAGIILIVVGVIVPLVAWVWWYFARKYKAVAAVGGTMAGLDILSGGRL